MKNIIKSNVFKLACVFIRKHQATLSEALKIAWRNIKLRIAMATKIVAFTFRKTDGSIREAIGTLKSDMLPQVKGTGRPTPEHLQLYYDIQKQCYRCFNKIELLTIK
jgi:hypothetical protein